VAGNLDVSHIQRRNFRHLSLFLHTIYIAPWPFLLFPFKALAKFLAQIPIILSLASSPHILFTSRRDRHLRPSFAGSATFLIKLPVICIAHVHPPHTFYIPAWPTPWALIRGQRDFSCKTPRHLHRPCPSPTYFLHPGVTDILGPHSRAARLFIVSNPATCITAVHLLHTEPVYGLETL
jgi:hypothetical protein